MTLTVIPLLVSIGRRVKFLTVLVLILKACCNSSNFIHHHVFFHHTPVSKTDRLFDLIQRLRRHKYPVPGKTLAHELGISTRTLYRDIATLQVLGADIEGEPGLGYVLKPSFMLPPLMFSHDELEAIILGMRYVAKRADSELQQKAQDALYKIAAVLPQDLRQQLDLSGLMVGPAKEAKEHDKVLILLRQAIKRAKKIQIHYHSLKDEKTKRVLWPIALAFFDEVKVLVGYCELRQDFRHFRTDKIEDIVLLAEGIPHGRRALLAQWRQQNGIPEPI